MKLNPQKSAFGAVSGKFLGFLVSRHGVEANQKKIRALLDMQPPSSVKDVQRPAGWIASLGSAEFFKILRNPDGFL